jgi:TolB protein
VSRSSSRRLLATAVAATSVALLASACGTSTAHPKVAPVAAGATRPTTAPSASQSSTSSAPSSASSAPSPAGPQYAVGTPLISDGSATVTIGGTPVRFPTAVSEASWSPDGSRIAFIDGSGNVATARPDGSGLVVLVTPNQGSKLSAPSWQGGTVLYTELNAAGTHFVRQASVAGQKDHANKELYLMGPGSPHDVADTLNPVSVEDQTLSGTSSALVFQSHDANGPDLWIHWLDGNARGGADPATPMGPGSWPALSPSEELAFVGSNGGIDVVPAHAPFKDAATTQEATKVADATGATHLTWTPDGASVAYSTPSGIMEVAVGKPGAAPTQLSAKPGVVSFLPKSADRVVTLAGSASNDLIGASIAVSRHRWETQTGTTKAPAGGGPHGPLAMSATIIAADDPATAQKELGWAGLYGPTLLTTGDTLDPRLVAEVKRVLGTPNTRDSFDGLDTVNLVGAPGAIPAGTDAAFTKLGYKVVHVAEAPKANQTDAAAAAHPTIAVVDPSDTAALTEAQADGAHVLRLTGGKLSAADTAYLAALDTNYQVAAPQIVAFGNQTFAAATALTYHHLPVPAEALGTTHADWLAATAMGTSTDSLTVVATNSPTDLLLADLSTPQQGYYIYNTSTVTVDPAQGISPTLKALLETRSADINEVDLVDTTSKLPTDVLHQLGTLISGPLGVQTLANQTADDLAKSQPVLRGW